MYHAGAAIASNYLVTLHRAATRLFEAAGAPPEALVPLMTRTIENGFELTGPIARGDWNTVDAHVRAIHDEVPSSSPCTSRWRRRRRREGRPHRRRPARGAPASGTVGLVPTMGALHAGHEALLEAARAECDFVVMSLFVNEAQFDSDEDFARYPRDEERDLRIAEDAGVDIVFAPAADELFPPGLRHVGRAGRARRWRPSSGRATSAGSRRCA